MTPWIDTHCHLDGIEFAPDRDAVRAGAMEAGVGLCVIPAVAVDNFAAVQALARRWGDGYGLGIHPMCVPDAHERDLQLLEQALEAAQDDPHLVAVGEIGLDFFVPGLDAPAMREKQEFFLREQLKLARRFDLPVLLHSRRSVDAVLKLLRQVTPPGGIAHAFVGSRQQADAFIGLGCKLGFGGAMTFERATRLRALATELPLDSIVMETDSPDIAPHWLYVTAEERAAGRPQARNTPAEIPRMGQVLADLRTEAVELVREQTSRNALQVLPRLQALLAPALGGA
ncbi:TatD family hydrolase [Brachymonas denitrificans]|uniref:TatD family hydrolase n=1 Tax=Brachymonas denitrificans TaxID=28220 RepID=UPI002AFF2E53|nr:TatD family hydrolase [Brachymonas denitrificans]